VKIYGGATLGANTFTGAQLLPLGSVSAPSLALSSSTNTGIFWRNAAAFNLAYSGTMRYEFGSGGDINVGGSGSVGLFMNGTNAQTANDVGLSRVAAGIVGVGTGAGGSIAGELRTGLCSLVDGVAAPSATAGVAKLFVDTADGDLKIIFGDGTTKVISADT
jgi:hypothetical protein